MMENQIQVYEPSSRQGSVGTIISQMFKDLFSSGDLAYRLFIRDKKSEYRQSIFGVLWAFFTPLATTLVWIFMNASGAVKITGTTIPYPVFVFLGTMIWSILTESLTTPLNQTSASRGLLSKVNFPKEAILTSGFYKILFNTGIKLILIAVMLIIFKVKVDSNIFLFPIMLVFIILFGYSFGLLITPIGMLYKDVGRMIPLLMSFLMYLSPVVYKNNSTGTLAKIIDINPLTPIINTGRNLLSAGPVENPIYLIIITAVMLVLLFIGWMFYRVSIPIIVERM